MTERVYVVFRRRSLTERSQREGCDCFTAAIQQQLLAIYRNAEDALRKAQAIADDERSQSEGWLVHFEEMEVQ